MGKLSTSERIQHIKKQLGIVSNVKLGALAGATKSVVGQWISGDIKNIAPKYAYALEEKTPFLAKWIMLEEGPETRAPETQYKNEDIRVVIELMERLDTKGKNTIRAKVEVWIEDILQPQIEERRKAKDFTGRTGTR